MSAFRLLFILLVLANYSFSQENNAITNDTIIPWNKSYKLKWEDFRGELNPNVFAYAVTSYKIDIIPEHVSVDAHDNILNYQDLDVRANFYKNQSWTVSKDLELLNHEQLHFDIAELYARKIRDRFSELKALKEKRFSMYWNAYSKLWNACRQLQKNYDLETNHGAKKSENDKWVAKINALL
jgi:hypothetical protein